MIALDVRDRRHPQVEHVRCVEPAAHPDLDDGEVHSLSRQLGDGGCGEGLELGRGTNVGGHAVDGRQDPRDGRSEVLRADRVAVDRHALAIADEVRLRHRPDAQPGGDEHRAGHGDHGSLAVRAAHQRPAQVALGMSDLGHEALDALEAQADAEAPALGEGGDRVAVGEPVGAAHVVSPRRPRRRRTR